MTNADWIRSLPNDKLAEFVYALEYGNGQFPDRFDEDKGETGYSKVLYKCLLEWLEKECDCLEQ